MMVIAIMAAFALLPAMAARSTAATMLFLHSAHQRHLYAAQVSGLLAPPGQPTSCCCTQPSPLQRSGGVVQHRLGSIRRRLLPTVKGASWPPASGNNDDDNMGLDPICRGVVR